MELRLIGMRLSEMIRASGREENIGSPYCQTIHNKYLLNPVS